MKITQLIDDAMILVNEMKQDIYARKAKNLYALSACLERLDGELKSYHLIRKCTCEPE